MSSVPDNLRRLVLEGQGSTDAVRNELLLALVDAVERLTAEQNITENPQKANFGEFTFHALR
jgi:hypothetical protein